MSLNIRPSSKFIMYILLSPQPAYSKLFDFEYTM